MRLSWLFLSIRDKMPLDECDWDDYNAKHKDELKMSRIEFERNRGEGYAKQRSGHDAEDH